jgi:hypothetical protein
MTPEGNKNQSTKDKDTAGEEEDFIVSHFHHHRNKRSKLFFMTCFRNMF